MRLNKASKIPGGMHMPVSINQSTNNLPENTGGKKSKYIDEQNCHLCGK